MTHTTALITELQQLWERTLGDVPKVEQFHVWEAMHTPEVIRRGILRTAQKHLEANGVMPFADRVRLASAIMESATVRAERADRLRNTNSTRGLDECV